MLKLQNKPVCANFLKNHILCHAKTIVFGIPTNNRLMSGILANPERYIIANWLIDITIIISQTAVLSLNILPEYIQYPRIDGCNNPLYSLVYLP